MFFMKSIVQKSILALTSQQVPSQIQQAIRTLKKYNDRSRPPKFGYSYDKLFKGGLLPRVSEEKFDEKLPLPLPKFKFDDKWSEAKRTFGQNDYIDIFGDGSVQPIDLIKGPTWLVGFRGNEMQRLIRRLKFEGDLIRMTDLKKHASIKRRIKYLYWRYNWKFGGKKK
jgi:large subunit ribosomal protein L51